MNLLQNLPDNMQKEVFETLIETKELTLERIISKGHVTPEGKWYDQDRDEWVTILTGWARLRIQGEEDILLSQGDHLIIPAHKRHRVAETAEKTIWLALHFNAT